MYDPATNKINRGTRFGTAPGSANGQFITQAEADRQLDDLAASVNDALAAVKIDASAGYGDPTGTVTRAAFNTATATLVDVAQRLGALITDLKAAGVLKS